MARVTRALPPDLFVQLVLAAIPTPSASTADGTATATGGKGAQPTAAAVHAARGGGNGGPRIVPVVVAAAGPAEVAPRPGNQAPAAAAAEPAPAQPHLQPFAGPAHWQHHLNQHAHAHAHVPWLVGGGPHAGGPMPLGPGVGPLGVMMAAPNQPEPLVVSRLGDTVGPVEPRSADRRVCLVNDLFWMLSPSVTVIGLVQLDWHIAVLLLGVYLSVCFNQAMSTVVAHRLAAASQVWWHRAARAIDPLACVVISTSRPVCKLSSTYSLSCPLPPSLGRLVRRRDVQKRQDQERCRTDIAGRHLLTSLDGTY
jgi:hypothetical protein